MKVFIFLALFMTAQSLEGANPSNTLVHPRFFPDEFSCKRIITLSPALTELVVKSGLESYLVGHSTFSRPLKNSDSLEVGSLYNLNLEVVYRLAPTIIFSEEIQDSKTLDELEKLGVFVVTISLRTLEDILQSPKVLARFCQPITPEEKKVQLAYLKQADDFREWLTTHQESLKDFKRILIFYGDGHNSYQTKAPSLAAGKSIHRELIEYMGGSYRYQGTLGALTLNEEGLFQLDPELIIILNPSLEKTALKKLGSTNYNTADKVFNYRSIEVVWPRLVGLSAYKKKAIFVVNGPTILLPTLDTLWQLATVLDSIGNQ